MSGHITPIIILLMAFMASIICLVKPSLFRKHKAGLIPYLASPSVFDISVRILGILLLVLSFYLLYTEVVSKF